MLRVRVWSLFRELRFHMLYRMASFWFCFSLFKNKNFKRLATVDFLFLLYFRLMKSENWNSFMLYTCIQSPWTMLCFYLGTECFPVRPLSSHFLVGPWYGVYPWLPASTGRSGAAPSKCLQPCPRTWFLLGLLFTCFISRARWEHMKCCSDTVQCLSLYRCPCLLHMSWTAAV